MRLFIFISFHNDILSEWLKCEISNLPFLLRIGFACNANCLALGGLLPHPFTLAHATRGGLLSVALSLTLR